MAVGHRKRIREKIQECGLAALHDHELLEYLLFPFIPRKDVSQLARLLLVDYGSMHGVMTAPYDELIKYKDMTATAAQFLPMIPEIYIRANSQRFLLYGCTASTKASVKYLQSQLSLLTYERLMMIALDDKCRYVRTFGIDGTPTSAQFDAREVVAFALRSKAGAVVIAHNHPNGSELPSREDIDATLEVHRQLKNVGIELHDHIIIAGNKYFSLRSRNIRLFEMERSCFLRDLVLDYEPTYIDQPDYTQYDEEDEY